MTPFFDDGDVRVYHGDAVEQLRSLPDESVHCVVTSPPFFGLRDYGTGTWEGGDEGCDHSRQAGGLGAGTIAGTQQADDRGALSYRESCGKCGARRVDTQIGLESSPQEWAAALVAVFEECRRVLRRDGTFWCEVGDGYAQHDGGSYSSDARSPGQHGNFHLSPRNRQIAEQREPRSVPDGCKRKDLIGAPWLLAFALRDAGWWLRGAYPWVKRNCMPESVRDRFTVCSSTVFQFAKSSRYFFDGVAISEPSIHTGRKITLGEKSLSKGQSSGAGVARSGNALVDSVVVTSERWPRGVFDIPTEPNGLALCEQCGAYWERGAPAEHCGQRVTAHYAAYPQALVERIVKCATSERGVCGECGAPWVRETDGASYYHERDEERPAQKYAEVGGGHGGVGRGPKSNLGATIAQTIGWRPSCDHDAPTVPATVLDPFAGSGTTLLVARRLGRHAVGVELREAYCRMMERRLAQLSLLF